MKDAMWKVDPTGSFSFSDFAGGTQTFLQDEPDLTELASAISSRFSNQTVDVETVEVFVYTETPNRKSHTRGALKVLEEVGKIVSVSKTDGKPAGATLTRKAASSPSSNQRTSETGTASHSWPSRSRPVAFGVRPPHCLKKKGTSAARQASRSSRTQSRRMGRYPGPDSPPAMTHPMPSRLMPSSGPSRGSHDRNRTPLAPHANRRLFRARSCSPPTHPSTSSQARAESPPPGAAVGTLRQNLIGCAVACRPSLRTPRANSSGTRAWNRSLIELTKTVRGVRHRYGSANDCGCQATPNLDRMCGIAISLILWRTPSL